MAERWEIEGAAGLPQNIKLWSRDVPHLEKNLQVFFTGVREILSEKDPEHRKLFENVFQLICSTREERRIKILPRRTSGDTPIEFGFQFTRDLSQTSKSEVGFTDLQPVMYIDETRLFGSSDITAIAADTMPSSSRHFLQAWDQDMSTQQSSTEVAEGNIRDWQEETALEGIANDPHNARDFVLARFQGRQLAQLLLPFAMAATYYNTVTGVNSEKPVEKFPPEGKDIRKIPPELLFQQEREPLFFDSFDRIYSYWGQKLGCTEEDIRAAIPHDLQNIAAVGFVDFLDAIKSWDTSAPVMLATAHMFFTTHSQEDKHYMLMLKMAYNKFIVLRALFYKEFADQLPPQAIGKQLVALWDKDTR